MTCHNGVEVPPIPPALLEEGAGRVARSARGYGAEGREGGARVAA